MLRRLTTKTIECLPPAGERRYEVRDDQTRGLLVRVSPSGEKVFYLVSRLNGRPKRFRIGRYPIVSLADARSRAKHLLRDIELGEYDDGASIEVLPTLEEVRRQFIDLYARPRNRDWKGTQSILRKFDALASRSMQDIRRADVVRVLDEIVASGTPFRANRALAAMKKLMSWCLDRGILDANPLSGLQPPAKETSRDRVLSDAELRECWVRSDRDGFPFGDCVKLLVLTGQRRGEVSGMRWSELDLEQGQWTLPASRSKNGTASIVPLSRAALQLLQSLPRFVGSDLVFSTTGTTPISGFGRAKRRISQADQSPWRLHDLRRTVATRMAMDGAAPHVIEAVLNHRSGVISGVAAIYNRYAYLAEKRSALEAWSERVGEIIAKSVAEEAVSRSIHQSAYPPDHRGQSTL